MGKLIKSFSDSITSDLTNVVGDYTEVGIDNILEEETLKDIPVINTLVGIVNTGINIKNYFLLKKILKFLNEIKDIPLEERVKFMEKNYNDNGEELGEKLIYIIDQLDELEKANIIANLFRSFVYENINKEMFMRLSIIVKNCFIKDLYYLKDNNSMNGYKALNLYNNGLVGITDYNEVEPEKTKYTINVIGDKLIKFGFSDNN